MCHVYQFAQLNMKHIDSVFFADTDKNRSNLNTCSQTYPVSFTKARPVNKKGVKV